MNLVIDVGNTRIKMGVFDLGQLKWKGTCKMSEFIRELDEVAEKFPEISHTLISPVGNFDQPLLDLLEERYSVLLLDATIPIPFINQYATPQTLGVDRIAVVSAAAVQFPNQNVLVVDAGTCITYDYINDEKQYLGGAISPGIELRYRALHSFTARLPFLGLPGTMDFIGDSTENSMHSGVVNGVVYEIDGFIENYRNKFGDLTVILTGGDTHFLRDRIKNDIFANSNFLLEGLNHILEFNIG